MDEGTVLFTFGALADSLEIGRLSGVKPTRTVTGFAINTLNDKPVGTCVINHLRLLTTFTKVKIASVQKVVNYGSIYSIVVAQSVSSATILGV